MPDVEKLACVSAIGDALRNHCTSPTDPLCL
jgi:hypothetical protein